MKRFVVPPTWPSPPRRSWVPPKTWRPDPSWPPPPEGWRFWVDGKGNAVRGPVGRYGGASRKAMYAGIGGMVLLLGVNFWAVSAIGLFGGDSDGSQAVHVVDDSSPTPSETVVPPKATQPTSAPPPVQKTTVTPTRKPTPKPTKTRTTERETEERSESTPSRTPKPTRTTSPPRPGTTTPPTREELLRQYCIQRGWDPEWCDPDNWPQDPADDPRNEEP